MMLLISLQLPRISHVQGEPNPEADPENMGNTFHDQTQSGVKLRV